MLKQEFQELSKLNIDIYDVTFDKIHKVYMKSKLCKSEFVRYLILAFKDWIWEHLGEISLSNKCELFHHFVIYALDSYKL